MPYAYCADEYCDSCGQAIIEDCKAKGQEDTGDSNDFPQWVGEEDESDSPRHCGSVADCLEPIELSDGSKVGALLGTNLTMAGVDYVREAIAEGGMVAEEVWANEFDYV
jgi:hypothetical protein